MLASISCEIISSRTREYSSTKNLASSRVLISSPKTSIVKQVFSLSIFFIKLMAECKFEPATYLPAIRLTINLGAMGRSLTINLPNPTIYLRSEGEI